jgi:predicted enzyme related to lactoylglutathione lyase
MSTNGFFTFHELYSPDLAAVRPFYEKLLGWTLVDVPLGPDMNYTIIRVGDLRIGGMNVATPDLPVVGWTSYISVDDVDSTVQSVTAAGGSAVSPAMDIPGVGRIAYLTDPAGSHFSVFRPGEPDEYPAIIGGYGNGGIPSWHELATPDVDGAIAFYTEIAPWQHTPWDMGEYTYHGMVMGEMPVAGIFPGDPAAWTIYFETPGSLDEAIAQVPILGGSLVGEKATVPGTGSFQIVTDPAGSTIGLLESESMD